ncbi:unnamed protein product, partial [Urochloa humidicola]
PYLPTLHPPPQIRLHPPASSAAYRSSLLPTRRSMLSQCAAPPPSSHVDPLVAAATAAASSLIRSPPPPLVDQGSGFGHILVAPVHLHGWELVDLNGRAVPASPVDEDPDLLLENLAVTGKKVGPRASSCMAATSEPADC